VTRGRRALLAVLQIIRGREVAARVRVSPASVSYWLHGLRRPSARSRAMLERHVRIPATWWDEPVTRQQRRSGR
jgi:transcriptional regulator with XRE-family HTH domain